MGVRRSRDRRRRQQHRRTGRASAHHGGWVRLHRGGGHVARHRLLSRAPGSDRCPADPRHGPADPGRVRRMAPRRPPVPGDRRLQPGQGGAPGRRLVCQRGDRHVPGAADRRRGREHRLALSHASPGGGLRAHLLCDGRVGVLVHRHPQAGPGRDPSVARGPQDRGRQEAGRAGEARPDAEGKGAPARAVRSDRLVGPHRRGGLAGAAPALRPCGGQRRQQAGGAGDERSPPDLRGARARHRRKPERAGAGGRQPGVPPARASDERDGPVARSFAAARGRVRRLRQSAPAPAHPRAGRRAEHPFELPRGDGLLRGHPRLHHHGRGSGARFGCSTC